MKAVDYFSRDVHSFWATTFQFDLKLFDQFLLRRLGNAPLNSVVLCDEDCLTESLSALSEVDMFAVGSANRRYLLRGVKLPSGGRFHPKTYLFASRRRTVLLVGSGNLTRTGLDRGRETFVAYSGSEEDDLPIIRAWGNWVRALVAAQGDPVLRRRFEHLAAGVPELSGPGDEDAFCSNDAMSLLDQLQAKAPAAIAELHVRAPYYDEQARALEQLIQRLAPTRAIHVHLGARTSVNGGALRRVLDGAECDVYLHGHEPTEFVHAKLIGLIGAEDTGLLLCGSANLSRAALMNVYGAPAGGGNCEVVVVRHGSAAEVADAFLPPNGTIVGLSLEDIEALDFQGDEDPAHSFPVRLRSAEFLRDGRLHIEADQATDELLVAWEEALAPFELADGVTKEVVPEAEHPEIVWLVDGNGERCSNPVVIDDRDALDHILGDAERGSDRPSELRDEDERSQLVALLTWANRRFIFDIDDTAALRRANNAQELQQDSEDTGFWERYVREELSYDPRSQTYRRVGSGGALTDADLLLREIEAMLHAAPADRRLRLLGAGATEDADDEAGTGHPWSFTARERLRARNLLRRWARALADPRHAWLSPEAPAQNYEALLEVLTLIWLGDTLEDEHVEELLGEMWAGFLGSESRRGFLQRAEPELARETLKSLSADSCELAAGLAYTALHPENPWHEWIYEWQPFLKAGLRDGVFRAGTLAQDVVEALCEERPSAAAIDELLRRRSEWVDDDTWASRIAEELDLSGVRIVPNAGFKNVTLVVRLDGLPTSAHDPRLITLARRAIALKKTSHVLLEVGTERFLLRFGEVCRARIGNESRASIVPIDEARLAAVEEQGGTLAELLGVGAAA
jgi:hypothetical protein